MISPNPRLYGTPPYKVVLVHGGPGATGDMKPVAEELLSKGISSIEPLQTAKSVADQLSELHTLLAPNLEQPYILVGHSWGAWLAFLFAAKYPASVAKLILVSSGPFESSYAQGLMPLRMSRLSLDEQEQVQTLISNLQAEPNETKDKQFLSLGELMSKADSFSPIPHKSQVLINDNFDTYQKVWDEAANLRETGELLKRGKQIACPVVAIHGDYDAHPAEGIREPLSKVLREFKFILLKDSGHTPWYEKLAKDEFYNLLLSEIES